MYDGRRVGAVVLARAGSTRLPGKLLRPLGRTSVLGAFLERLGHSATIDEVVLGTTTDAADDVIATLAIDRGLTVVRGAADDVVGRMVLALEAFSEAPEVVVRANADNPLVMPTVVDEGVALLVDQGVDLVTPFEQATWPFGYGLVSMSAECLRRIHAEAEDAVHREHVESYCFERPDAFTTRYQVAPGDLTWPELVLTLDHASDLARLERALELLDGVPIQEQPRALIDRLRRARVWIESKRMSPPGGAELVVLLRPDGLELTRRPERGVIAVDSIAAPEGERLVLRYVEPIPEGASKEPLWIDRRLRRSTDTAESFLAHAWPLLLPHVLAAPARSVAEREGPLLAAKSVRPAARRGFGDQSHADFPQRILVEAGAVDPEPAWLDGLLGELERFGHCMLVCASSSHSDLSKVVAERLTPSRLVRGTSRPNPFAELLLDAAGRMWVGEAHALLAEQSVESFWRGAAVRRVRAEWLNGDTGAAA